MTASSTVTRLYGRASAYSRKVNLEILPYRCFVRRPGFLLEGMLPSSGYVFYHPFFAPVIQKTFSRPSFQDYTTSLLPSCFLNQASSCHCSHMFENYFHNLRLSPFSSSECLTSSPTPSNIFHKHLHRHPLWRTWIYEAVGYVDPLILHTNSFL